MSAPDLTADMHRIVSRLGKHSLREVQRRLRESRDPADVARWTEIARLMKATGWFR